MKQRHLLRIALLLIIPFFSVKSEAQKPKHDPLSKAFLEGFSKRLNDSIPSLGSFIISKDQQIVYEQYFHGADRNTVFSIKSVTKSITSVLAGIARDEHLLPDLSTPVLKILPEYDVTRSSSQSISNIEGKLINDSIRKTVTLRHLLTMQAGFDYTENSIISTAMSFSSDPVRFVMDLPFEEYPGDRFNYSSGETYIFGAALARLTNTSLKKYADQHLFGPLGIQAERWDTDFLNRNLAGSELFLKSEDLLKIGNLILNRGQWKGRTIVSEKWIEESTAAQVKLDEWDVLPQANGYGYYWWRRKTNGHQAVVAVGYGGQLICIVPDLKMIIVTTCFLGDKNRGRTELLQLHHFIDEVTL